MLLRVCLVTILFLELQTTALTQGLERIPDQIGYLVISEDGVLAVSNDNDIHVFKITFCHMLL